MAIDTKTSKSLSRLQPPAICALTFVSAVLTSSACWQCLKL